jgi:hypothetical protein
MLARVVTGKHVGRLQRDVRDCRSGFVAELLASPKVARAPKIG